MIFNNFTGKMEIIKIIITLFLTILRAPKLTWSVTMWEFWSSKKVEILYKRCIGSNFIVGPYQTFRYWVAFAMRYEAVVCDYLPTNQRSVHKVQSQYEQTCHNRSDMSKVEEEIPNLNLPHHLINCNLYCTRLWIMLKILFLYIDLNICVRYMDVRVLFQRQKFIPQFLPCHVDVQLSMLCVWPGTGSLCVLGARPRLLCVCTVLGVSILWMAVVNDCCLCLIWDILIYTTDVWQRQKSAIRIKIWKKVSELSIGVHWYYPSQSSRVSAHKVKKSPYRSVQWLSIWTICDTGKASNSLLPYKCVKLATRAQHDHKQGTYIWQFKL